jgi:TolA-binding protein
MLMELTDSTLIAPGLSLATFSGLLLLAAKAYKEARQIDVEGEKKRRQEAEARESAAGSTHSSKLEALAERVRSLEDKIDEMRVDHETALLDERGKNFQLRRLLRENGVEIPEELGPS